MAMLALLAGIAPVSHPEAPRGVAAVSRALGPGVAPAAAAFEAPRLDPAALGRGGSQPAWPAGGASGVIGDSAAAGPGLTPDRAGAPASGPGRSRRGLSVATGRWEGLPDLATEAMSGWSTHGRLVLSLAAGQRRAGPYAESEVALSVGRPAGPAGRWGWVVELAWGRWGMEAAAAGEPAGEGPGSAAGGSGPGLGVAVGARISPVLSLAARWREWGGALAGAAPGLLEAGIAARIGAWTLAGAVESGSPGRSARTLVSAEAAFHPRLRARGGFRPASGESSLGVGVDAGRLGVDLARRSHPRLGPHTALGLTLRAGGAS